MDILAAMFAYLVCVTGIVAGLVMSFVVFFSAPGSNFRRRRRPSHRDGGKTEPRYQRQPISAVKAVAKTATKLDGRR